MHTQAPPLPRPPADKAQTARGLPANPFRLHCTLACTSSPHTHTHGCTVAHIRGARSVLLQLLIKGCLLPCRAVTQPARSTVQSRLRPPRLQQARNPQPLTSNSVGTRPTPLQSAARHTPCCCCSYCPTAGRTPHSASARSGRSGRSVQQCDQPQPPACPPHPTLRTAHCCRAPPTLLPGRCVLLLLLARCAHLLSLPGMSFASSSRSAAAQISVSVGLRLNSSLISAARLSAVSTSGSNTKSMVRTTEWFAPSLLLSLTCRAHSAARHSSGAWAVGHPRQPHHMHTPARPAVTSPPSAHNKTNTVPSHVQPQAPHHVTHLCHKQPEVHLPVLRLALELKVVVLATQLADRDVLRLAGPRLGAAGLLIGRSLLHLCATRGGGRVRPRWSQGEQEQHSTAGMRIGARISRDGRGRAGSRHAD